jgi:general secretion pathway protein L
MQIGVGLIFRWFAILASVVEDFARWRRVRNSVVIKKRGDDFIVERILDAERAPIAKIPASSILPTDVAQRLRNHAIDFELDDSEVVARRLTVPFQAKDVLSGIVRNQIERLSPWPFDKTAYGFEMMKNEANRQSLDVSVLMASQKTIDGLRDQLSASNVSPERFVSRIDRDGEEATLALWTRATREGSWGRANAPRLIAAGVAAFVLLSASITAWALIDASAIWGDRDDVAARARALRQNSASSAATPATKGSERRSEHAWAMKENTPAAVMVLDALASALPDNAYLTDLSLERAAVRITGLSNDPPPLIDALQQSGRFTGVHFFAATTKDPEKGGYRFSIEAQAAAPNKSAGD